jgi:hypothetical protein
MGGREWNSPPFPAAVAEVVVEKETYKMRV